VRRDSREKIATPLENLAARVGALLNEVQLSLYGRALKFREDHTTRTDSWDEFKAIMEGRPGFVLSPWCGDATCEAEIKSETQATIRNLPMNAEVPEATCLKCGKRATTLAYFAKAY
jgi:prolyl-tRNA synthetase